MPTPRVLVLYNEPTLPADHPDAESEHDILYTADMVIRSLSEHNVSVSRLGVTLDPSALIDGIRAAKPDAVFNLYEGTAKFGNSEPYVAGILELLQVPYTGCPPTPMIVCRSKPMAKRLFSGAGLPTAPFRIVADDGPMPACDLGWPVIVKPGLEDGSVGIDQTSVVTDQEQLEKRVRQLLKQFGPPVLLEKFIRGREFHIPVLERDGRPQTLPFTEILFVPPADAPNLWPIVTFDAKWRPNTREFAATPAKNPAENVSPELHAELTDVVLKAFELVGCRDYARIDLRVDEWGRPYILEVNPNPCISPMGGVEAALATAKIPYPQFTLGLVAAALRRGQQPELADAVFERKSASVAPTTGVKTPPKVKVRPAKRGELDSLRLLVNAAECYTPAERERLMESLTGVIVKRFRPATGRCLVAEQNKQVVGFAWFRTADEPHGAAALEALAVAASSRRQGIGRALVQAVEHEAAKSSGRLVIAEVSSAPGFMSARQLFPRLGYHHAGDVAEYYRDGYSRLTFVKSFPNTTPESGLPIVSAQSDANPS